MFPGRNDPAPLEIRLLAREQAAEALELAFSRLDESQRAKRVADALGRIGTNLQPAGKEPPPGDAGLLLGAYRASRLVGASWVEVHPGRTALAQMPVLVCGEPEQSAVVLIEEGVRHLEAREVCLVQVLLEKERSLRDEAILRQAGFAWLADLFYLVCLEAEFPVRRPDCAVCFEPYSLPKHARFSGIVEATYEQTLDCPGLNGVRRIEDVLAGYRATGRFDPAHWLIVRKDQQDVGCLILADHPQHGNMELVYMGLIPGARGHGWGTQLVRHAQWLAARAGRRRLVLAVDANNLPALRIYAACGFEAWERRVAYVRVLRAPGTRGGRGWQS